MAAGVNRSPVLSVLDVASYESLFDSEPSWPDKMVPAHPSKTGMQVALSIADS